MVLPPEEDGAVMPLGVGGSGALAGDAAGGLVVTAEQMAALFESQFAYLRPELE
jgi:hypothetical protein